MAIRAKALIPTILCIAVSSVFLPATGSAEEVPIVEGNLWSQSSTTDKRSYLIGVSNFISLEYAYQSSAKTPPTPEQSSVPDFFNYTDDVTLDGAIAAVNDWYKNHPDETDTPVLTVLWRALVEPKL